MKNFIEIWTLRYRAVKRLAMWHYCSGWLPCYLVAEYPKSGGTWFSQMLSDALDKPFSRNTGAQKFQSAILGGHHLYSPNFKNVVTVVRDGRDCIVSAYYYMLFKNEINRQFGVDRYRGILQFEDYDDIRSNLPRFIEYLNTDYRNGRFHFSWSDFMDSWLDTDVPYVRYEDLLVDAPKELMRITEALTGTAISPERAEEIVEKYSFKRMSGRKKGQENKTSFVRKGIAGDWKNHFTLEACQMFDKFAGEQLIKLGYEKDHSWAEIAPTPSTESKAQPAESNAS